MATSLLPLSRTVRRVLAIQPLPQLQWPEAAGYSEFQSLALARLTHDAAAFDVKVSVAYPRCEEDLRNLKSKVDEVDLVVAGDFRYYAYFANPLPAVRLAVEALGEVLAPERILVAGRHVGHFPTLTARSGPVRLTPSYTELMDALTGGRWSGAGTAAARADALPAPGPPDLDVLADGADLPGSFSRPGVRMAQLLLTRGCPFECAFCEAAGSDMSTMDCSDLEETLDRLNDRGTSRIIFWDEVFGWPYARSRDHLRALARSGMTFNCNTRLDALTEPVVSALAEAGCREILFGLELSPAELADDRVLGLDRGKSWPLERIETRIALLRRYQIAPVASVIIGLPDDNEQAIADRLAAVSQLDLSYCYVRPLVPFPESELYRRLQRLQREPYQTWSPEQLDSFPHGYPTVSAVPRRRLAELCGR